MLFVHDAGDDYLLECPRCASSMLETKETTPYQDDYKELYTPGTLNNKDYINHYGHEPKPQQNHVLCLNCADNDPDKFIMHPVSKCFKTLIDKNRTYTHIPDCKYPDHCGCEDCNPYLKTFWNASKNYEKLQERMKQVEYVVNQENQEWYN